MSGPGEPVGGLPEEEGMGEMVAPEDLVEAGGHPYDDDDEDDDEDPRALLKEFGEHKLMQRAQKALFEQLERELERVQVEHRELEGELKKVKNQKEQVGVELYGNQQQLAQLQMALESLHNKYQGISDARVQEEDVLQECKERHAALKATNSEKEKALLKAQAELDALNETIMQVERYNTEMKSEIAITRRATYKAEASVQDLEKQKQGQDLYIDSLNTRIKSLRSQVDMYDAQHAVQKQQTDEAKKILSETTGEMELIAFEKKQLMQQWKASLINLTKRDEAVAAATKQLEQAKREIQDMTSEIIGLKREIIAAQAKNETLVATRDRLQKEEQTLEEQTNKILMERDQLAERYQMLQRSMAQTDEEEKGVDTELQEVQKRIETVIQNIQVVNRERQQVELDILSKENDKLTVAKAVRNFMKAMKQIKTKMHEKEIEAAGVENEMSRIRVDALNTEAHNVQLKEMLDKQVKELEERDKLIEKYQLEIRQRNDEIEKKMYRVDKLNRKYEQMVEAAGDDEGPLLGPLEATIKNIHKEMESLAEENAALQRDWLADQTSLVTVSAETEDILERNGELRARIAILAEKKLRSQKEIVVCEAEVKRLEAGIQSMHQDMAKLNELLGKNSQMQTDLQRSNSVMELEFVNELKELEHASIEMERKLQDVKEQKAGLLDDIMEAERQLLLWEKKIQLEKETQAALDPDVGTSEIHTMEKEIHRMELRKSALRSEKERLVKEIETAIHKREAISLRQLGKKKVEKKVVGKQEFTRASLSQKVSGLKKGIDQTARSTAEHIAAINETKQNIQAMTERLEKQTSEYGALEEEANALQTQINDQLYYKQRQMEILGRRQKMLKRYQALERGQRDIVSDTDKPIVEKKAKQAEETLGRVKSVIDGLRSQFGHLDEVLDRVLQLTTA